MSGIHVKYIKNISLPPLCNRMIKHKLRKEKKVYVHGAPIGGWMEGGREGSGRVYATKETHCIQVMEKE